MIDNREKLKLSNSDARRIVWGYNKDFKIIDKNIVDHSRWSILYEIVVQNVKTGKFYKDSYSIGATESQDEQPYECTDQDFQEVFPVEKTITVYE